MHKSNNMNRGILGDLPENQRIKAIMKKREPSADLFYPFSQVL